MKRVVFISILTGIATPMALAHDAHPDSLRMEELNEVVVHAVKVDAAAPFAVGHIDRQRLSQFAASGQELPMLLRMSPSVVASFDNGLGIGTGYMRIRGSADSRINVTLDGVPLNSPEDQQVFWANMNSYAASLSGMQVQRGVGTSTNGDGAFGATIAMTSKAPEIDPSASVTASYGSYNTYVLGGEFSTGLLYDHLIIDGRYSETHTDGWVHHTASRSGSYYGGVTWMSDDFALRYKHFGNFETTEQAWDGLDKALYDQGYVRYNPLNEWLDEETGTYHPYPHLTTDNFWQNRNILSAAFRFSDHWRLSSTLHYTHGHGYYDNYKADCKLSKFGLTKYDAEGNAIKRADFIRKKGLTQDSYGAIVNALYRDDRWDATAGASVQLFDGYHYGDLTLAEVGGEALALTPDERHYYDSDAEKVDASLFVKGTYRHGEHWSAYGDLQYRHVDYRTDGKNDKFLWDDLIGGYRNQLLTVDEQFDFFNPKAGVSYTDEGHTAYASWAMSHREPSRNNYTDNGNYPFPKAERMMDYEAGYRYTDATFQAAVNLYFMDYDDQLVQTGAVSDIGEPLTTNIRESYRLGVELSAAYSPLHWLSFEANATFSENKIKNFDEVIEDWSAPSGYTTLHHDEGDLAFSPAFTANAMLHLQWKELRATWHTAYVGRQYLDNTGSRARSLEAYSVSNLNIDYTLPCRRVCGLKEVLFGLRLNNIFNQSYCPNGGVYSAIDSEGAYGTVYTPDHRYTAIWVYPMAGLTAMGTVTLRF